MAPAYLAADSHLLSNKDIVSCVLLARGQLSSGRPTSTLGMIFRSCRSKPAGLRQMDISYNEQSPETFLVVYSSQSSR